MARRGLTRRGRAGRFRYYDANGRQITDESTLERITTLRIPPAWKDVWIAPSARSKLQATGLDAAGRKQYLYHADFRAQQEQAKFDRLVQFAEKLPDLRRAMSEHMELEPCEPDWVCALAVRLINSGWFRVGSDRYAQKYRTFGICTLRPSHVQLRGNRVSFRYRGKHKVWVRTVIVDDVLAFGVRELLALPGRGRLFRYRDGEGGLKNLTDRRLNEYIRTHMGGDFTAKDFRTWGGTLIAAIALAERGPAETEAEARRAVASVMRRVGERLGNTPAVARSSYVSPGVIDQYLEGRTLEHFRPRHLRVVGARDIELDPEEQALLSLLRSARIRRAREAA